MKFTLFLSFQVSFFDYMAYIPLFLSMHDNIIDNPLDMTEKYSQNIDKYSPNTVRDMNPLGLPLKPEFLDYPKEINPSGIPLGKPVLTQAVEQIEEPVEEVQEVAEQVEDADEDADTLDTLSTPPSER